MKMIRALFRPVSSASRNRAIRHFTTINQSINQSIPTTDQSIDPSPQQVEIPATSSINQPKFPRNNVGLFLQTVRHAPNAQSIWSLIDASTDPLIEAQVAVIFSRLSQSPVPKHRHITNRTFDRLCEQTIAMINSSTNQQTLRGWTGSVCNLYGEYAYGDPPRRWISPSLSKLLDALVNETINRSTDIFKSPEYLPVAFRHLVLAHRRFKKNEAYLQLITKMVRYINDHADVPSKRSIKQSTNTNGDQIINQSTPLSVSQLATLAPVFVQMEQFLSDPDVSSSTRKEISELFRSIMDKLAKRLVKSPQIIPPISKSTVDQANDPSINQITTEESSQAASQSIDQPSKSLEEVPWKKFAPMILAFAELRILGTDKFLAKCCDTICQIPKIDFDSARTLLIGLSKCNFYHRGVYRHLARCLTANVRRLSIAHPHRDATQILYSLMRIFSWRNSKDIIPLVDAICLKIASVSPPDSESNQYRAQLLWALVTYDSEQQSGSSEFVKQCIAEAASRITVEFLTERTVSDTCWVLMHECALLNPALFEQSVAQLISINHARLVRKTAKTYHLNKAASEWLDLLKPSEDYNTDLSSVDVTYAPRNTVAIRNSNGAFVVLLHRRGFFLHEFEKIVQLTQDQSLGLKIAKSRQQRVCIIQRDFEVYGIRKHITPIYQMYDMDDQPIISSEEAAA